MKKHVFIFLMIGLMLGTLSTQAQVVLPKLISNGMVLQRGAELKIWGWATAKERVSVTFMDKTYKTRANGQGSWHITLKNLTAGGPYSMTVSGTNTINLKDIMVGDVWLLSGQSNIEFPFRRVAWNYPNEQEQCANPNIRHFAVKHNYDFNNEQADVKGGQWQLCTPDNLPQFSAVGYFYAKALYAKYQVPIGLLNASLGGSPAQAWMSEEALKQFPQDYAEMQRFKSRALIDSIEASDRAKGSAWTKNLNAQDKGYQKDWLHASGKDWDTISVPRFWWGTPLEGNSGAVWYKRTFTATTEQAKHDALLVLGVIVDADSVFINGKYVGNTTYMYPPRRYKVPAGTLHRGENTITVRIVSNGGHGGFVADKDYEIQTMGDDIQLSGTWHYRSGAKVERSPSSTFVRWKPGGLYNGMIAPLQNYTIKGALWYQGESNTGNPKQYDQLMPALIGNWRTLWAQGNFPFMVVQLANFMDPKDQPTESNWARLRESQLKLLSLPNTGLAVTIDIGEYNDIHPLNKKELGDRLSLIAQKLAYGETNVVASGPRYKGMRTEGNKIIVSFDDVADGLKFKNNYSSQLFAIAGADKKFVWAKAQIKGNEITVWSDAVQKPVAVRYAWADNPAHASLYNSANLPASPFRSDDW